MAFMYFILACVVTILFAAVIYYILPREKSFEEGVAEKKSKPVNNKSKYSQQKKPMKAFSKEKGLDKKPKLVSFNPVEKIKKIEPTNNTSSEKLDFNAIVKKKNEKIQPKSISPIINEKTQNIGNKNVENGKNNIVEKICTQDLKNIEKTEPSLSKCDNTLVSVETEIDGSISNSNGDKNPNKNLKIVSNEKTEPKSFDTKALTFDKTKEQKKTQGSDDIKGGKLQKFEGKEKPKVKLEEKVKNAKDSTKNEEKVKEKLLASPSKNKKAEDKFKIETLIVSNSISPMYNGLEENKFDKKEDKIQNNINAEQKTNGSETKQEKNQSHKKNSAVAVGGKVSPIQNGKNNHSNSTKITKKQATEIKTLQKISYENDGLVNVNLLIPLIAKADLSHTEIQNLIDLLLNKQQENCIIDAEWIEGSRQDPIVKLKKQLAEKEKLLTTEQEAHQALQNKLKELRSELNVEKHTIRQLEESLNNRHNELQALNAKLQVTTEEKQNFSKQIQQLQAMLDEERLVIRSLKEDSSKTKSFLQKELLAQRQQLEMHIAHLKETHQQTVVALENQLGQIAGQLQEQEAANAQMSEELRECVLLRDQIAMQESQIAHFRQTATATQDLVMQLEEQRAIGAELDRRLKNGLVEVNGLKNELKSVSEQLSRRNAEVDKFNCTVKNMSIENQELHKEHARLNEQISNVYSEKKELQLENERLNEQLLELKNRSRNLEEMNQLENVLNKNQISELKVSLEETLSRNAELEKQNKSVEEIEDNFKKQLKKNDELRGKNWKAMEALSAMEKSFENKVKEINNLSHEIKIKEREELVRRLKRHFNSNIVVSTEDNTWFEHIDKLLAEVRLQKPVEQILNSSSSEERVIPEDGKINMLNELEKQNNQLHSMVSLYKGIIADAEGMLNRLQKRVEQEENRWSERVQALEAKLEAVVGERDLLLNKTKMQNGCVSNDDTELNEHKLNCDSKHSSILTADYS